MKKIIRIFSFFIGFVLFCALLIGLIPDQFSSSYQRALVKQYDYYTSMKNNKNKIVFVGNSSLYFGLNLDEMENLTGRPCCILGNHAGYGMTYPIEMSKANLREGDTVVIELVNNAPYECGSDLLLTGIGKRYDLYQYFVGDMRRQILRAYPSYLKKNFEYWLSGGYKATGAYSSESYDKRGSAIYNRPVCIIPEPYTDEVAKTYSWCRYDDYPFNKEFISYINDYVAYCKKRNVKVYFTLQCYLDEAVKSTEANMDLRDKTLSEQLHAPLISRTKDYIFPRKYIYDFIAHCNTNGAKVRTKLLYHDLKPYLSSMN